MLQAVENSLRTGAEYDLSTGRCYRNGQIRWIAGRGHVEFNEDGQPVRMRGASLDITKRKQAKNWRRRVSATRWHTCRG